MEFLKYFITEDIYVLPDEKEKQIHDHKAAGSITKTENPTSDDASIPEGRVSKPAPEPETTTPEPAGVDRSEKNAPDSIAAPSEPKLFSVAIISSSLNEEEEKLLSGITKAIKIPTSSIQRISSIKEVKSHRVIAFGQYADLEGYPFYEVITKGTKQLLICDTLSVIDAEHEKKKKLWSALQQMFSV